MPRQDFKDVVLIFDDELDKMLDRPKLYTPSVKAFGLLLRHTLQMRARFSGQKTQIHSVMFEVGQEMGIKGGALGPVSDLADRYGEMGVDREEVLQFFRTWVMRCRNGI